MNADDNSTTWMQSIGNSDHCPNCKSLAPENFCPSCGQKQIRRRLSWNELLQELFARLLNHERGLFFTFWNLLVRPGPLIRDYVSGKQKPYVNPLTFYFVGAAVQLLTFWFNLGLLRSKIMGQLTDAFARQPNTLNALGDKLGANPIETIADAYIGAVQQGYTYVALFMFCLPWSTFIYLGHRFSATPLRFAETAVYSLYTFGQILILTGVFGIITVRLGMQWQGLMAACCYLLFPLWAHRGFFPSGLGSSAITLMATLASSLIFMAGILGVFLVSLLLQIVLA